MEEKKYLYRYERNYYIDYGCELSLRKYLIKKTTPKGYWIGEFFKGKDFSDKWVSNNSRKRFAYPTPEEALVNFKKRTEYYIKILKNRLEKSNEYLMAAEQLSL